MQRKLKYVASGSMMLTFAMLILSFGGCSGNFSPLGVPNSSQQQDSFQIFSYSEIERNTDVISAFNSEDNSNALILKLEIADKNIFMALTDWQDSSEYFSQIQLNNGDQQMLANINIRLMNVNQQPAALADFNINLPGWNLSEIAISHIRLYYYNQQSHKWDLIDVGETQLNPNTTSITMNCADFSICSRYALAHSD
ncbi:hypothetical protein JW960_19265 [candidate division KSB1 bacterium]|nr:hypothetical protein [candidate division KSB1 bacterium]